MSFKKVLIVDYDKCDSLMEIPCLFKKAGCIVDIYTRRKSWLSKSRYHDNWIIASENSSQYITDLRTIVMGESYNWVVVGDDYTVRLVRDISNDDIFVQKIIPLSKLKNKYILGSKAGLSRACLEYGILTPPFVIYDSSIDPKILCEQVSFPLMLKVNESSGGEGVFLCHDLKTVENTLQNLNSKQKENLVFQKYISGQNIAVEAIYKNGILITYAYSIVMKTISHDFGVSSERRYVLCPEIQACLSEIGMSFGLNGFSSMTFMCDGTEYYLIEADLRPQSWYSLATLSGTDFTAGIREFFSDTPVFIDSILPENNTEIFLRHFPRDLLWCAEHKNYLGMWHWVINKDNRWMTMPWRDPQLLATIVFVGTRYYMRKSWKWVSRQNS